jgi:sec-independent protein translocase protein TatA
MLSVLIMNIGGSEWIIIIFMGLFLLFGTKKLPELSRTLGKAIGEYQKTRQLLKNEIEDATNMMNSNKYIPGSHIKGPVASERLKLEAIASSIGINHFGRTDDELRIIISKRIQDSSPL